jgi:hypothetical protein
VALLSGAPRVADRLVVELRLDQRERDRVAIDADQCADDAPQLGPGLLVVAGRLPVVGLPEEGGGDDCGDGEQQLALVLEVLVERGARDARAGGDRLDPQLGVAVTVEQELLRRLDQTTLTGCPPRQALCVALRVALRKDRDGARLTRISGAIDILCPTGCRNTVSGRRRPRV